MKKKAQVSIIYFSFLVLFSIVFLFAIYTLSTHIIEDSTNEFSEYQINNIAARIKASLVEMKRIATDYQVVASYTNLTKVISIPERIGADEYLIRGENNSIVIQTYGSNSRFKRIPVYWWDITLDGQVLSTNSKIKLVYYSDLNKVRIS